MADGAALLSAAGRGRRRARKEEYRTQREVVRLLAKHLDPDRTFFTSLENLPRSPIAAFFQRQRGVRSGLPDLCLIFWDPQQAFGKPIFVELKSRKGSPSPRQREVALELQAAGAAWHLARTPAAALTALYREGVCLGGWEQPAELARWEGPFSDPRARLPEHPEVAAARREATARYRERKRARAAAAPLRPEVSPDPRPASDAA